VTEPRVWRDVPRQVTAASTLVFRNRLNTCLFRVATPNVQHPIGRRVMLRHLGHFNRTFYLFILFIGCNGAHL